MVLVTTREDVANAQECNVSNIPDFLNSKRVAINGFISDEIPVISGVLMEDAACPARTFVDSRIETLKEGFASLKISVGFQGEFRLLS